MALQFSLSSRTLTRADVVYPVGISSQLPPSRLTPPVGRRFQRSSVRPNRSDGGCATSVVKCSLDTEIVAVGQVTDVNQHNFWSIVGAAGNKIVVLDMYTQWCGPCKVMAPKFEELSKRYADVVFLKLDCNKENKDLAKELGIRVVPTFKILKEKKIVKEVRGAKFDELVMAIEAS